MSVQPPAEQFDTRGRGPLRWLLEPPAPREGLWMGLVLAVLACLPVMVARYPQMVDYPAHLARFHVMLDYAHNPLLQRYYGFEWRWMGNLGTDLLVRPLAAVMPLEAAGRLIVLLIVLLTGLGILAVEWTLRRRVGVGAMLAFSFIWSPAMLLGFMNFGLSLAMALFAFALWVRLDGKPWRAALFVPIGVIVWLAHVSGWGTLGVMVFGHEWSRSKSWRAFVAPWPLALPFAALVAGGGGQQLASYGPAVLVYKKAIWKNAMRDSVQWLDHASTIAICAVLVGTLVWSLFGRKRADGRLIWAAAAMCALSLALPRHVFGGDYVDARMIYAGLMVGCLSLRWHAPRVILWLAPALFLGRLALTTETWHRESLQTERLLAALDHIPHGARLASVVVTERFRWGYNSQEHVADYALVRKDALVNANFALPLVHMLTIREGGPYFRDPFHRIMHRPGTPIDLSGYLPARDMDWFWYIGDEEPARLPPGARIVWRAPGTFLAKLAKGRRDS